jgi:OOP family OmpA-OmpF porin
MKLLYPLAGFLLTGLLSLLCLRVHQPVIEQDLTTRTSAALSGIGIGSPKVSADGRFMILEGVVPDEATRVRAGEEAEKVWGVAWVDNRLRVEAGPPPVSAEVRQAAVNCQEEFRKLLGREMIQFETGSAVLSKASHDVLDELAAAARKCPAASVEVSGHTDPRGSRDMNMRLSRARAQSVVSYLASKGIAAGRLSAEGYGPDKPVAENNTAAGMQKNRRIEFTVKGI